MNPASTTGQGLRTADADTLGLALQASRRDTLALFELAMAATAGQVPQRAELNPPLWELGHIGWFQTWWLGRNPARAQGWRADPELARPPSAGDVLYDSARVAHGGRWQLPLPDADTTRQALADQLDQTLALLRQADASDDALYFFRLALLHEDMHHEAALYSAQSLGWSVDDPRWQPQPLDAANPALQVEAGSLRAGDAGPGFAFDNELGPHTVDVAACQIDSRALRWADYLPFVEAGGYQDARWWSDAGCAWLAQQSASGQPLPRYLRPTGAQGWQQQRGGRWLPLDPALPACHLSCFEAEAWCAWAGRRLPTEAEWQHAATRHADEFHWGAVWEWTASPFLPYPGFVAHPYRDYSAPWFGSRRVLRGASFGTQPRLHHAQYRNFFPPERNDIFAGFRSCAA
jgi:ergothioneine biosynthesis protein EgtB